MMRALFLGAHADDVEISAAGTVITLVDEGWDVVIYNTSSTADRNTEGEAAAYILRAHYIATGNLSMYRDIKNFDSGMGIWTDTLPEFDLIVTPSSSDSHQDHRAAADLGLALARKNNVDLWRMNHAIPGGIGQAPTLNHFVVFSLDVWAKKERALWAHTSQFEKYGRTNWIDIVYSRDRYLGGMSGFDKVRFAEGFEIVMSLQ